VVAWGGVFLRDGFMKHLHLNFQRSFNEQFSSEKFGLDE